MTVGMTVVWEDEGGGGDFRVYWWCVMVLMMDGNQWLEVV